MSNRLSRFVVGLVALAITDGAVASSGAHRRTRAG